MSELSKAIGRLDAETFVLNLDRGGRRSRAQCDPKYGWEKSGDKCVRSKRKKRKLATGIAVGVGVPVGVAAITAASVGYLYKSGKAEDWARDIAAEAYLGMAKNAPRIEAVERRIKGSPLPDTAKKKVLSLGGGVKRFMAESFFLKEGGKIVGDDKDFVTFQMRRKGKEESREGEAYFSVASTDSKLLMFRTSQDNDPIPSYEMSFAVDNSFARPKGGREEKSTSRDLVRLTRKMFTEQVKQLPSGSLVRVEAYDEDDAGKKRKKIYEKMGFTPLSGGYMWATVTDGELLPLAPEPLRLINSLMSRKDSLLRLDRNAPPAKCDPEYGWKRKGNKCVRVKKRDPKQALDEGKYLGAAAAALALGTMAATTEDKKASAIYAAGSAMAGAALLAMPLYEIQSRNAMKPTKAPKVPNEGISEERLALYDKKFKRGDMIRAQFTPIKGQKAYHVGIYNGLDEKTGEPTILHVAMLPNGKGQGVHIRSMRPTMPEIYWEYEKVPNLRISSKELDKKIKALEPVMNKRIDYNIADKNCETFARMVLGLDDPMSTQSKNMSKIGKKIGRSAFGSTMSLVNTRGKKAEATYAEVARLLGTSYKFDSVNIQENPKVDWSIFLKRKGSDFELISPEEALRVGSLFPKGSDELKVQYLKNYFLFVLTTNHVIEGTV